MTRAQRRRLARRKPTWSARWNGARTVMLVRRNGRVEGRITRPDALTGKGIQIPIPTWED